MDLADYAEFLIKSICKNPESVKVSTIELEDCLMIEIIVDKDDKSAVIGRSGNTISAIKTLLRVKSYIEHTPKIKINVDSI
ncbi:MAG: KH domain-containing protein [bacterium]